MVEKTLRGSGYVDNTNNMSNICHSLYTDFNTKQCWSVYDDLWPFIKRIRKSPKPVKLGAISNFDERLGKSLILLYFIIHVHRNNTGMFGSEGIL